MSEKSEVHVKKERIARKVWRILEQLKWRSKDQNSKSSKIEDTRNQIKQGGEFKEIKDQIIKEVKNSKELHSGIINCNSRLCMLGLLN